MEYIDMAIPSFTCKTTQSIIDKIAKNGTCWVNDIFIEYQPYPNGYFVAGDKSKRYELRDVGIVVATLCQIKIFRDKSIKK